MGEVRDDGRMTGRQIAALYGMTPGAFRVWAHRRKLAAVEYDTDGEAVYNLSDVHKLRGYPPHMGFLDDAV